MIAALIALVIGIFTGYHWPMAPYAHGLFASIAIVVPTVCFLLRKQGAYLVYIVQAMSAIPFCFFGALHTSRQLEQRTVHYPADKMLYEMRVIGTPEQKAATWLVPAEVGCGIDTLTGQPIAMPKGQVYLYVQRDSAETIAPELLHEGSMLAVRTRLVNTDAPLIGNDSIYQTYYTYLQHNGISATGYVRREHCLLLQHTPARSIGARARRCQQWIAEQYSRWGIRQPEIGILTSLTIGYRDLLDREVRRLFASAGAMHVLAVSGLHVGIIATFITWFLTLGGRRKPLYQERRKRWIQSAALCLCIWGYAILTGLTPSVTRAGLMLTLAGLTLITKRQASLPYVVLLSAFLILMIRPLDLFSISFQLSYAAVLGIALFTRSIERVWLWWLPRALRGPLAASAAAVAATLPITAASFHLFPVYGILLSPIVILMATISLICAMISLPLSLLSMQAAYTLTYHPLHALLALTEKADSWPYAVVEMQPSTLSIGVYIALLCLWALCANHSSQADKGQK